MANTWRAISDSTVSRQSGPAPAGGQARDDAAHLTAHGVPLLSGLLRPLAQGIFVNNLCIYFNIL